MDFRNLILDGGMGSLLLERSGVFASSESFNFSNPLLVEQLHREYIQAGSNVIFANTFGANRFKIQNAAENIVTALKIARKASEGRALVALDMGPTGKLLGKGGISFAQAYDCFAEIVEAGKGLADLIVLETHTDLGELRAGLLAAKEHSDLPVIASMSFGKGGRTAFGVSPEAFAISAQALGASAVGINCSLGPNEILPLCKRLAKATFLPIMVKPNAGMPELIKGKTIYNVSAKAFASAMIPIKKVGADMLGGCCGTTPEYIDLLVKAVKNTASQREPYVYKGELCSSCAVVEPKNATVVGERINPTGKKLFQRALLEGDFDYAVAFGPKQEEQGAKLLDVNVGLNGTDELVSIQEIVEGLQRVTHAPLIIDSSDTKVLELGLRLFNGRAIVNSVCGKKESLCKILPLAKRYGAAVIGLCLDENGIPERAHERVEIAKRIIAEAEKYGIDKKDVYIDCLTLSEGSQRGSAQTTLEALKEVKKLGCRTVLGISNISFGMPCREDINAAFLQLATQNGLDMCIINPKLCGLIPTTAALELLEGAEGAAEKYIAFASGRTVENKADVQDSVCAAVKRGDSKAVSLLIKNLLTTKTSQEISQGELLAALDEVGVLYERGEFFLPQLIASAEAAKAGFDLLFEASGVGGESKGRFVLATVKGDVHDIGKNIVKAVVSNYGYEVTDLGKDVCTERILEVLSSKYPCVLGLSALMTTTAVNMAETIKAVKAVYPLISVLVGGAVLTQEYAQSIGGIYCCDAQDTVKKLNALCGDMQ